MAPPYNLKVVVVVAAAAAVGHIVILIKLLLIVQPYHMISIFQATAHITQ